MEQNNDKFCCLADYDAYGFDLDHTLAKYKLVDLITVSLFSSVCVTLSKQDKILSQNLLFTKSQITGLRLFLSLIINR